MVSATNIAGNGLKDWIIQRATAVFFAVYIVFLFAFVLLHAPVSYEAWRGLFQNNVFKIASVLALFTMSWHAWIGLWTVTTDYIRCNTARMAVQAVIMVCLLSQFVWGLLIVWGQ